MNLPNDPVKAEDIGRLDENSAGLGIPKAFLMECAGLQATNEICAKYSPDGTSLVFVFCGLGNNGGDGLVIARHLATRGVPVHVALVGNPQKIRTDEARLNWQLVQKLFLNIKVSILQDSSQVHQFTEVLDKGSLTVDALLGTGIAGKLREPISSAIDVINACSVTKISVDVPSGLDPNTGNVPDKAVNCDFRITFHREKVGLADSKAKVIAPIGTPLEAHIFIGRGDLLRALRKRNKTDHKGQYGRLLVIGGSENYSGAPALASMMALELGIDLCTCMVPKGIGNVVRKYSPGLIVREGQMPNISLDDISLAQELTEWATAVVIGPGLGMSEATQKFCDAYFPWLLGQNKPFVVDADGLKHLGKLIKGKKISLLDSLCVLSPHRAELQHLVDIDELPRYDMVLSRGSLLSEKLQPMGGVCILKGVYDYIIAPTGEDLPYRVNTTGCPEMAVGGTGDLLAGLIGAFLVIGNSIVDAAGVATYLNGHLGELAVKHQGSRIQSIDIIREMRPFLMKL